jgi:hypothetical protein
MHTPTAYASVDGITDTVRGKGKVIPVPKHHTMKVYRSCGCKAPYTLNLGTRWRWWSASHFGCLTPGKESQYLLARGWRGPITGLDKMMKRKIPSPARNKIMAILHVVSDFTVECLKTVTI